MIALVKGIDFFVFEDGRSRSESLDTSSLIDVSERGRPKWKVLAARLGVAAKGTSCIVLLLLEVGAMVRKPQS